MRHTPSSQSLAAALALVVTTACSTSAQPARPAATPGPSDIVATVGKETITLADVDKRALKEPASAFGGAKLEQALYIARRAAIDELVGNRLMDA